MTPREKAIELCGKYHLLNLKQGVSLPAKECALIAIDEIIEELKGFDTMDGYSVDPINFWNKVKEEIHKL